ncbi:hypothetical protein [Halovenus salina]|uniref:DUF8151 domain-containing protein n=1 Tax=Halovenus salina TaxID=1510225 RepID=A0ABD5W408_9EURY|nr:hypothetical protein [Halovenus salina]
MYEEVLELIIPVAVTALYTGAVSLFAALGVLFEYKSLLFLSGGETFIGLWAAVVGVIALNAAYHVLQDRLAGAVAGLRTEA